MVNFEKKPRYDWADLVHIVGLLRSPEGCPWDRAQTHQSIRRNFLEEVYEVLDALDRGDAPGLREELGDVLLQIALHARMEEEAGRFSIGDVVDGIAQKLVFRHPHVFGSAEAGDPGQALANWEEAKRREKGFQTAADAIEAVPHTLPALWRAEKVFAKARKGGLDEMQGVLPDDAAQPPDGAADAARQSAEEALGDTLLLLTGMAQRSGIDPEAALHSACDRFEQRFRAAETARSQS